MKNIYIYLSLLAATVLGAACNNEWEDEQYEQYVSFKASIAAGGGDVITVYVRYKDNGKVTYQLSVIVSGPTVNTQDRDIHMAVDAGTLRTLNTERFSLYCPELWYIEMEEDKYEFPETVHIPVGSCVGQLNIDFNLQGIDMPEKWILPLSTVDDALSNYQSHPRKNYAKALLKVVLFNDYSGSYTVSSMKVYIYINGKSDNNARTMNKRTGYVVDNNSVFLHAGLINEDMDRDIHKKYKINVHLKEDGISDMVPGGPTNEMEFQLVGTPIYSSASVMDATRPYLERRYVQIMFEYDFQNFTHGGSGMEAISTKYGVEGSMMLQRNINTQIPGEDQQIEW